MKKVIGILVATMVVMVMGGSVMAEDGVPSATSADRGAKEIDIDIDLHLGDVQQTPFLLEGGGGYYFSNHGAHGLGVNAAFRYDFYSNSYDFYSNSHYHGREWIGFRFMPGFDAYGFFDLEGDKNRHERHQCAGNPVRPIWSPIPMEY